MKTAIILHGMPSKEEYFSPEGSSKYNQHWLPWIQQQLMINGIDAHILQMPEPYEPDYGKWRSVFEQFTIDKDTLLIGHSCGGGFLIRWLGENNVKVHKVALVAPWIDPNHTRAPRMFDELQLKDVSDNAESICLFISSDDDKEELDTANQLRKTIKKLQIHDFTDRGHFTFNDMKTVEFPELVEFLLE